MYNLSTDDIRQLHRNFISNPTHSYIVFEHFNKIVDSVVEAVTKEKSRVDVIGQNGNDGLHYDEINHEA
jgi:hypothetical protein